MAAKQRKVIKDFWEEPSLTNSFTLFISWRTPFQVAAMSENIWSARSNFRPCS